MKPIQEKHENHFKFSFMNPVLLLFPNKINLIWKFLKSSKHHLPEAYKIQHKFLKKIGKF